MYINHNTDTIFAPATVPGTGAITIIRISGPDAIRAAASIVHSPSGGETPCHSSCPVSGMDTGTESGTGAERDAIPANGSRPGTVPNNAIAASKGYRIHFGQVYGSDGRMLDEVLVSVFRAPHSYTGEDSVEISCHASSYIANELSALLVREGLRPAEPGEFTQRAFLNGKMDLAQAEAVADVIASRSAAAHHVAFSQLKGGISSELQTMRNSLLEIASLMELELDFSEEDVEFADRGRLHSLVDGVMNHIHRLIESFRLGNALKDGIPVAIVGATNVGKSTLLNALLGEERAIVSDIHGTTRDTIEETMNVGGILFRFIDTAGLRDTDEEVEKIGIGRSYKKLHAASVVLGIVDASRPETALRKEISDIIANTDTGRQKLFIVFNKCDLAEIPVSDNGKDGYADISGHMQTNGIKAIHAPETAAAPTGNPGGHDIRAGETTAISLADFACVNNGSATASGSDMAIKYGNSHHNKNVIDLNKLVSFIDNQEIDIIYISARNKTGIAGLKAALVASQKDIADASDTVLITNIRHLEALSSAYAALERVRTGLSAGIPTDLVAQDLRESLHHIGAILGEISTPEILSSIFSRFCIGK